MKFNKLALQLTRDLYKVHQKEQPITKNSIISSALLFNQKPTLSFRKLKQISSELYTQIQLRDMKTYMSVAPQPIDINETVKNLGFQVIGKYESKDAKVNLKTKDILNKQLSLAHYTNSLAQNFVIDAFVAHALSFLESK